MGRTARQADKRTDDDEICSALPLDLFVFCQYVKVLAPDPGWFVDRKAIETIAKIDDLCLRGIALLGSRLGDFGRRWIAGIVSSFDSADLQFEPLELCAFVTRSSGLGSVKSNSLAIELVNVKALVKSFARVDSISTGDASRTVMVVANGDGFARTVGEGSSLWAEVVDPALAPTASCWGPVCPALRSLLVGGGLFVPSKLCVPDPSPTLVLPSSSRGGRGGLGGLRVVDVCFSC